MDVPLPLWGLPLNEYISHYQFEIINQGGRLDEDPDFSLTRDATNALSALARVGDGGGLNDSKALSVPVTMQDLRAILKIVPNPKAYRNLARPDAIGGCIKLMSGIKLDRKYSPFSYEYGYLCFRVLTVVLGICILDRSSRLNESIRAIQNDVRTNPQLDTMRGLGYHVSAALLSELSDIFGRPGNEDQFDWVFGWVRAKGRSNLSPLVMIPDIKLLSAVLWEDRKAFFKALKSTYHPGISAVIFVLWRVCRRERNPAVSDTQLTVLREISFRYGLIATSDQQSATDHVNMLIGLGTSHVTWENNTRQVDLEDCKEVIGAYLDRFNPSIPFLYEPIGVLMGPIRLRALARFVAPGTEGLLPAILKANVKRIWDVMRAPPEAYKPDVYVDVIRDTFANYAIILQNPVFVRANNTLYQELIDNIINYDLIDLAARAILMLDLPSGPASPLAEFGGASGSEDFLFRVKHFYVQFSLSIPKPYTCLISDHCLSEWIRFRSFLPWYSEVHRLIPEDRNHIRECVRTWNDVGKALGYQVHQQSEFKCDYARCHDPLGMGGVEFTCPICLNGAYCSARCQALARAYGGSPHTGSCAVVKAPIKSQPSI